MAQLVRTKLWPQIQASPGAIRFPNGETLREAQLRAVTFLDTLSGRHPKKVVAVCSHADVIRLALAHYAGVHIDLFQRLIVSPASVSAVLLGDRIPRIVRMNDTGSVRDLAPRRPAAARSRHAAATDGSGSAKPARPVRGAVGG
jgi:probable phosphoglycerate mutase